MQDAFRGTIVRICEAREKPSEIFQPVLEVQDVRPLGNDSERFAVILSDGEYAMKTVFGMGPFYSQISDGKVKLHCLLRLTEWCRVEVPNKPGRPPKEVITITNAEIVGFVPPERRVPAECLRKWVGNSGGGSFTQATQEPSGPPSPTSAFGMAPPCSTAAAPAPCETMGGQLQPPAAAWGAMGGDSLAEAATQDQPLFGERPLAVSTAQNPYSAAAGPALAAPGGQAYGFTAVPSGIAGDSSLAADAGGNGCSAAAGASAVAPGGYQQAGSAAMGGGYGLSAHGAASTAAPTSFSAPAPYSMPGVAGSTASGFGAAQLQHIGLGGVQQRPSHVAQQHQAGFGGAQPQPSAGAQQVPRGFGGAQQQSLSFGGVQQLLPPSGTAQQPHVITGSRSPASAGGSAMAIAGPRNSTPICALSPYLGVKWKIKARITLKSDIRKFNNQRGEGQLFKIELIDKSGHEISATFFGRAVDRFYEMLRPQQVYYFSRGSVKMANKRFDKGEHVITFDENTTIEAAEEDPEIPGVNYVFVPLADVERMEVNTNIDIKAVIFEAREPFTITLRKNNEERVKRELVLWDDSGPDGSSFLEMTIWGQNAHDNFEAGTVIYSKGMRISEWNGAKSLNGSSGYELNPDNPQAFALLQKFEEKKPMRAAGGGSRLLAGSRETIEEVRVADLNLGPPQIPGQPFSTDGPRSMHRHFVFATLTNIPTDRPPFYQACPEMVDSKVQSGKEGEAPKRSCNRKVTQNGSVWQCQAGHSCDRPNNRYLANRVQVVDHTGSLELSFFDEAGRQIFGCEANELAEIWEDPTRDAELQQRLAQLSWRRYLFRVTSKKETWQDEERVRLNADEGAAPNFVKEGQRMLAEVKATLQAPLGGA